MKTNTFFLIYQSNVSILLNIKNMLVEKLGPAKWEDTIKKKLLMCG